VNVLSPGQVDTPDSQRLDKATRQMFESLIPRGKMGRPEEIAAASLFLASDDASYVGGVGCRRRLLGHLKSTDLGECMIAKALTEIR
jgi:NAD(P)-dependent dehydrogenase (short-subunit alcohol dehydrogenase family)